LLQSWRILTDQAGTKYFPSCCKSTSRPSIFVLLRKHNLSPSMLLVYVVSWWWTTWTWTNWCLLHTRYIDISFIFSLTSTHPSEYFVVFTVLLVRIFSPNLSAAWRFLRCPHLGWFKFPESSDWNFLIVVNHSSVQQRKDQLIRYEHKSSQFFMPWKTSLEVMKEQTSNFLNACFQYWCRHVNG
jgi:hypothetical protein